MDWKKTMVTLVVVVVAALLVYFGVRGVAVDSSDHRYEVGDPVPLHASKIGPFANPRFASCSYPHLLPTIDVRLSMITNGNVITDNMFEKGESIVHSLTGYQMVDAPYKLYFRRNLNSTLLCKRQLRKDDLAKFRSSLAKDYYFQFYYDDLPLWGFIGLKHDKGDGDVKDYEYFLYKHIHFRILYNKNHVIRINAGMNAERMDITDDMEIDVEFTYSVNWSETNASFEKRMEVYGRGSLMPHLMELRWFAAMNSSITVLLLIGSVSVILIRKLKKTHQQLAQDEESANTQQEHRHEPKWKLVHGDVFRCPRNKSLFTACLASGTQLLALSFLIFILALAGAFQPQSRGTLLTALIFVYVLTSAIAGYTATSFYRQLQGTQWAKNLLLTAFLFPGPLSLMFCFLNTVAVLRNSTAALPVRAIVVLIFVWMLLYSPLLVLGGLAGKNSKMEFKVPCQTTKFPREIPSLPWYRRTLPQMMIAGFLPFSVIYVELYYTIGSVWGHKIRILWSILFIVYVFLLIATACCSVIMTYSQLALEDHKWWWRSLLNGGSTGLYIYGYCCCYYYSRTVFSGLLQISFFFGYMAVISYGVFLMLGTVGFYASLLFVRCIYGRTNFEQQN